MDVRLAAFVNKIAGTQLTNPYSFPLRPSEVVLMKALEKHKTIDINKMTGIEINSVRVQISRLRRKLPKGVKIQTLYGGHYFISPEGKEILDKYRREAA